MPRFEDYGRGAGIRRERRDFRKEQAATLAASRMAELEREQTGQTRRRGMMEAGETKRLGTTEGGRETRSLRQYGPESYAAKESGWRYGDRGIERTRLKQQEEEMGFLYGAGGFEERKLSLEKQKARRKLVDIPVYDKYGYSAGTTPRIADMEAGTMKRLKEKKKPLSGMSLEDLLQERELLNQLLQDR